MPSPSSCLTSVSLNLPMSTISSGSAAKEPLFLPEERDMDFDLINPMITPPRHPSQFPTSTPNSNPPMSLMNTPSEPVESPDEATQMGPSNSQFGLPQLLTSSQHQMQCATEPATQRPPVTPTHESSAPSISVESPHSSHAPQPYAVLSSLRHLATGSQIVHIFEQKTRDFFTRENAPSPEPRPNHSSLQPASPQDVEAETSSPVPTAPTVTDHPESASPRSDRRGTDAQLPPEALTDPVEKAPTSDCIVELTADEQDGEVPPDSDVDDQLQPQCENLRTEAKGKGKAIEVDSDNEGVFSDDDPVFDDVGDGDDSLWGGDSDVSEERAVPPPARPLKRSVTGSDDDDDEAPAAKRHKSSSRARSSASDTIIVIDSSDDMPSYVRPMNEPGPSKPHRPPLAPTSQKHSQKEEDAAVKRWQRKLENLWEKRKEMDEKDLDAQMKEILDEIYDRRWSLLEGDIKGAQLSKYLKKVSYLGYFTEPTRDRAMFILDAFKQRFEGYSLFLWKADKIIGKKPRK